MRLPRYIYFIFDSRSPVPLVQIPTGDSTHSFAYLSWTNTLRRDRSYIFAHFFFEKGNNTGQITPVNHWCYLASESLALFGQWITGVIWPVNHWRYLASIISLCLSCHWNREYFMGSARVWYLRTSLPFARNERAGREFRENKWACKYRTKALPML